MITLESRMAHLEEAFEQFGRSLASIEGRFDAVDRKIDGRFDSLDRKIDSRFDTLDQKIDQRFMWTIGVVLSTWLTTILAVFLRH